MHAGAVCILAVGAVCRLGAAAGAAGQAGEAHCGDGGGVCAYGGEPAYVAGALGVELLCRAAVDGYEGVDALAAAGVHGGNGLMQLAEDAQPGGGGDFIALQYEVGEAGAAGCVPAAGQQVALCIFLVGVGLPCAQHGGGEVPHALRCAEGQAGARGGGDTGFAAQAVKFAGAGGVQVLPLAGEGGEDEHVLALPVEGVDEQGAVLCRVCRYGHGAGGEQLLLRHLCHGALGCQVGCQCVVTRQGAHGFLFGGRR